MPRLLFFSLCFPLFLNAQIDWDHRAGVPNYRIAPSTSTYGPDGIRVVAGTGDRDGRTLFLGFADADGEWLSQSVDSAENGFVLQQELRLTSDASATYLFSTQGSEQGIRHRVYRVGPGLREVLFDFDPYPEATDGGFLVQQFRVIPGAEPRFFFTFDRFTEDEQTSRIIVTDAAGNILWERTFGGGITPNSFEKADLLDSTRAVVVGSRGRVPFVVELDLETGETIRDAFVDNAQTFSLLDIAEVRYRSDGNIFLAGTGIRPGVFQRSFVARLNGALQIDPNDHFFQLASNIGASLSFGDTLENLFLWVNKNSQSNVEILQLDSNMEQTGRRIFSETWLNRTFKPDAVAPDGHFLVAKNLSDDNDNVASLVETNFTDPDPSVTEFTAEFPDDADVLLSVVRHPDGWLMSGYQPTATGDFDGWLQLVDEDGEILESALTDYPGSDRYGPLLRIANGEFLLQWLRATANGWELVIRRFVPTGAIQEEVTLPSPDNDFWTWDTRTDATILLVGKATWLRFGADGKELARGDIERATESFPLKTFVLPDGGFLRLTAQQDDLSTEGLELVEYRDDGSEISRYPLDLGANRLPRFDDAYRHGPNVAILLHSNSTVRYELRHYDRTGNLLRSQEVFYAYEPSEPGFGTPFPFDRGMLDPWLGAYMSALNGKSVFLDIRHLNQVVPIAHGRWVGVGQVRTQDGDWDARWVQFGLEIERVGFNYFRETAVLPNPNTGMFRVVPFSPSSNPVPYLISDAQGTVRRRGTTIGGIVHVPELPAGIYFLYFEAEEGPQVSRFVVVR